MDELKKRYKKYVNKLGEGEVFRVVKGDGSDLAESKTAIETMRAHRKNCATGWAEKIFIETEDDIDTVSLLFVTTTQREHHKDQRYHVKISKEDARQLMAALGEALEHNR